MSELVIEFSEAGAVKALHMDGFDLGFLGDKKVYRQTEIAFSGITQKWDLIYLNESQSFCVDALTGFDSYESARTHEVRWLNDCRLLGIDPTSEQGIDVMRTIREALGCSAAPMLATGTCNYHSSVFADCSSLPKVSEGADELCGDLRAYAATKDSVFTIITQKKAPNREEGGEGRYVILFEQEQVL